MHFSSLIAVVPALLASSTTALAVPRVPAQEFIITNFFASGSPHSTITTYRFSISSSLAVDSSANCTASVSTLPGISYVPVTCCDSVYDCDWQFSFGAAPETGTDGSGEFEGYNLNVTNVSPFSPTQGLRSTGIRFFDKSDVKTYNDTANPNGNYEYLDVPAEFTMAYTSFYV